MLLDILQATHSFVETHPYQTYVIVTGALLFYYLVFLPVLSPLWKVPGPYLHRISRIPSLHYQRTHSWGERVYNLHKQYGNIVILSPNEISVNGSDKFVNDIYLRNFPKSRFYANYTNHGDKDNIFATLTNDKHLKYKKMIIKLYSKSNVMAREGPLRRIITKTTQRLIDVVRKSSVTGEAPDLLSIRPEFNPHAKGFTSPNWFNKLKRKQNLGIEVYTLFGCVAMDVVSRFELGEENGLDLLLHPEERSIVAKHRQVAGMGFWTTLMPQFWEIAASKLVMSALKDITQFQLSLYADAEARLEKEEDQPEMNENKRDNQQGKEFEELKERRERKRSNPTTLEALKKHGFFGNEAYSFLTDNLFAGHETTATMLCYFTYELSRPAHLHIQSRLKEELVNTFGKPKGPTDIIEDLEKVDSLPFLDAVFTEITRVHASIPGAEPRVVDKKPYMVDDISIPPGTIISCLPFALHRETSVFFDPNKFLPERWLPHYGELESEFKTRIRQQHKFMMPFGKGIRMCLGMNVAVIEMKMVIANLYWHFASRIDSDWCEEILQDDEPIKLGKRHKGENKTDQEMMCMNDYYTITPVNEECWLRWFEQ